MDRGGGVHCTQGGPFSTGENGPGGLFSTGENGPGVHFQRGSIFNLTPAPSKIESESLSFINQLIQLGELLQ